MNSKTCCPSCEIVFKITEEQLSVADGWARCGRCDTVFNALENMHSETESDKDAESKSKPKPDLENTYSSNRPDIESLDNELFDNTNKNTNTEESSKAKAPGINAPKASVSTVSEKNTSKKTQQLHKDVDLVEQWSRESQLKEGLTLEKGKLIPGDQKQEAYKLANKNSSTIKPIAAIKTASSKASELINRWRKPKKTATTKQDPVINESEKQVVESRSHAFVVENVQKKNKDENVSRTSISSPALLDNSFDVKSPGANQSLDNKAESEKGSQNNAVNKAVEKKPDSVVDKKTDVSKNKNEKSDNKVLLPEVADTNNNVLASNADNAEKVIPDSAGKLKHESGSKTKQELKKQSTASPEKSQLSIFDMAGSEKEEQKDLFNDTEKVAKTLSSQSAMLNFIEVDEDLADGVDSTLEKAILANEDQEKLAQEKLAQEKLAQEKLAQEKQTQEKLAQEKLAQEKLAQEKLAQEKQTQEKLAQEKLAQDKALPEDYILLGDDEGEDDKIDVLLNKNAESNISFQNNKKNVKGLVIKNSNRHLWKHKTSLFKKVCLVIAILALGLQLIFGLLGKENTENIAAKDALPWWCSIIDCEAAMQSKGPNINSNDIIVRNVSLRKNAILPNAWTLKFSIYNQSEVEQVLPKIKVLFHSEDDSVLASRIIDVKDHPEIFANEKTYETMVTEQVLPLTVVFQSLPWETFGYDVYLIQ